GLSLPFYCFKILIKKTPMKLKLIILLVVLSLVAATVYLTKYAAQRQEESQLSAAELAKQNNVQDFSSQAVVTGYSGGQLYVKALVEVVLPDGSRDVDYRDKIVDVESATIVRGEEAVEPAELDKAAEVIIETKTNIFENDHWV